METLYDVWSIVDVFLHLNDKLSLMLSAKQIHHIIDNEVSWRRMCDDWFSVRNQTGTSIPQEYSETCSTWKQLFEKLYTWKDVTFDGYATQEAYYPYSIVHKTLGAISSVSQTWDAHHFYDTFYYVYSNNVYQSGNDGQTVVKGSFNRSNNLVVLDETEALKGEEMLALPCRYQALLVDRVVLIGTYQGENNSFVLLLKEAVLRNSLDSIDNFMLHLSTVKEQVVHLGKAVLPNSANVVADACDIQISLGPEVVTTNMEQPSSDMIEILMPFTVKQVLSKLKYVRIDMGKTFWMSDFALVLSCIPRHAVDPESATPLYILIATNQDTYALIHLHGRYLIGFLSGFLYDPTFYARRI